MDGNGTPDLIKIGPNPDDLLPRTRAEKVLQLMMRHYPEILSSLIGEAATGAQPKRRPKVPG